MRHPGAQVRQTLANVPSIHVWCALWAILTAAGWLLPNHYYPWIAFHTDAWIAWSFLIGSGAVLLTLRSPIAWHRFSALAACTAFVPLLQFVAGLIIFRGEAWISTGYLLGFALSIVIGAHAEKHWSGKAVGALFLAIALASAVSVGMQLSQWLSLPAADLWILPLAEMRPFANLAQPNQMATLLLWGVISVAWGFQTRKIGGPVAFFVVCFFLFGIALTQSRTGIAAILMLFVMACFWRKLFGPTRQVVSVAGMLSLFFIVCLLALEPISDWLLLPKPYSALTRIGGADIRWHVFKLFADAALQRPWFGWGWSTLAPAQFAVAENHAGLGGVFQQSHNLFLDLILWVGVPIGTLITVSLVVWFLGHLRRVATAKDALLVMFVSVVGLHAMLELPLHYAYMLFPTGLVVGTLNARSSLPVAFEASRRVMLLTWLAAAVLLAAITRDYLLIEADFQSLRFERAYNMPSRKNPPRVLVLSQLAKFVEAGRRTAHAGMSQEALDDMRDAAMAFPSPANLYVYTAALALNGRAEEAQLNMRKMAHTMLPGAYEEMGRVWHAQSKTNRSLASVQWLELEGQSVQSGPAKRN